ncbi:hypothetical protein L1887_35880 [Cichorium endivia]|nr:hypothetical protein L1887_35880 [Cichorium endivia]
MGIDGEDGVGVWLERKVVTVDGSEDVNGVVPFLTSFIVICTASAGFTENLTGAQILSPPSPSFASHEIPDLPLPVSLPLFKKQHQRRTT